MKIAFLIMAYKNPEQLGRLIQNLNSKYSVFYIHIDKKSNMSEFRDVLSILNNHVEINLLPRFNSYWRGPGIIYAILQGLRIALKDKNINRIVLLSGQDYPIKSLSYIFDFYEKYAGKNFISYFKLPSNNWFNGGLIRINNYHFRMFGKTFISPPVSDPVHLYSKIFYKIVRICFIKPREFPKGLVPYGGFAHWQITAESAKEILDFVDKRPEYLKFHKYSWVPDELFFQTILLNSKNDAILDSFINNDLTYYKWIKNKPQAEILRVNDYDEIISSNKLFARKFDLCIDSQILDMIDANNHTMEQLSLPKHYFLSEN
jgi:hypothetical protein